VSPRLPGILLDADALEPGDEIRRRADLAADLVTTVVTTAIQKYQLLKPDATEDELAAIGEAAGKGALRSEAMEHASALVAIGREDEARAHEDLIAGVIYVSALDKNRCEACAKADDGKVRALDDPDRITPPNPDCKGGGRCRCMQFYVLKDEAT
jgi:hypothetical protein